MDILDARMIVVEDSMPRFYFHLTSMDRHIADDSGKELGTLNDAYAHARKLIDKILFHVGSDDTKAWKVVISNDNHNAQIIVPFPVSYSCPAHAEGQAIRRADSNPVTALRQDIRCARSRTSIGITVRCS
jgi:hypothetical protein